MKNGLQYKIMAFNFSGLFLVFIMWITAAMTLKKMESVIGDISIGIISAGVAALMATGFIGYLSAGKIMKPLAENHKKVQKIILETHTQKKRTDIIASTLKELEDSSQKIEHISETINEIRFQVHLLALNAAIEAAKAEKMGTGFAVVAEELKTLAQKTAEFSKSTQAAAAKNMETIKKSLALNDESIAFFSSITGMIAELECNATGISGYSDQ